MSSGKVGQDPDGHLHWFMTLRMYNESLIWPNSESRAGRSWYVEAMSSIMAHFPVTLMFQRV